MAGDAVRAEWLYAAARASQEILCNARAKCQTAADVGGAVGLLPTPVGPVERLLRQGLIFEILLGSLDDRSSSHETRTANLFRRFLESSGRPNALLDSPEIRAAALIHDRSTQPIAVCQIARAVGCHETRLRRCFRERFGISMRDFHTRCRVAHAIEMFASGASKTAAVALSVGYRSEKNFYRALRDVTGNRPADLKSMQHDRLRALAHDILLGLVESGGVSGGHTTLADLWNSTALPGRPHLSSVLSAERSATRAHQVFPREVAVESIVFGSKPRRYNQM